VIRIEGRCDSSRVRHNAGTGLRTPPVLQHGLERLTVHVKRIPRTLVCAELWIGARILTHAPQIIAGKHQIARTLDSPCRGVRRPRFRERTFRPRRHRANAQGRPTERKTRLESDQVFPVTQLFPDF
jgi:hypothetical protein